jgi:hypothetical protein
LVKSGQVSSSGTIGVATAIGLSIGLASVLIPLMAGATDSYEIADSLLVMGGLGVWLGFLAGLVAVSVRSAPRR